MYEYWRDSLENPQWAIQNDYNQIYRFFFATICTSQRYGNYMQFKMYIGWFVFFKSYFIIYRRRRLLYVKCDFLFMYQFYSFTEIIIILFNTLTYTLTVLLFFNFWTVLIKLFKNYFSLFLETDYVSNGSRKEKKLRAENTHTNIAQLSKLLCK